MLKVTVKRGGIERALKELKNKFIKTKVVNQCRDNKEFIKPSAKKRNMKLKAIYKEKKSRENEL
jgi:small subunit ribosomal protein S21